MSESLIEYGDAEGSVIFIKECVAALGRPGKLKILDIGCAFGTLVNQLSAVSDDYEVYGIDIDKEK